MLQRCDASSKVDASTSSVGVMVLGAFGDIVFIGAAVNVGGGVVDIAVAIVVVVDSGACCLSYLDTTASSSSFNRFTTLLPIFKTNVFE